MVAGPLGPLVDLPHRPSLLKQAAQNITILSFSKPFVLCWKHFPTTDIAACSWLKMQPTHFPQDYTTNKQLISFPKSAFSSSAQREQARIPCRRHPSLENTPMCKCQLNLIKASFFPSKSAIPLQERGRHNTRARLSPCQGTGTWVEEAVS